MSAEQSRNFMMGQIGEFCFSGKGGYTISVESDSESLWTKHDGYTLLPTVCPIPQTTCQKRQGVLSVL